MNSICCGLMLPNAFHRGVQQDHKLKRLLVHTVYSLSPVDCRAKVRDADASAALAFTNEN